MNQSTVDLINQSVTQFQANLAAYTELQTLAVSGWQTDQDAQAAAVTAATDPLNAQIATLTAQVTSLQAEIAAIKAAAV